MAERSLARYLVGLACFAAGCGPPQHVLRSPLLTRFDPALALPAGPQAGAALARASPSVRAQYLVDLFDTARLLGDGAARDLLWTTLGRPAGAERGENATREALQQLADLAERAGASSLAQLLDDDLEELDGGDALSVTVRRRRIAAGDDLAAGHALLALYASCSRPLADAVATVPWRRAAIANRCLYSLYRADPEPYFRRDPSERPPDPPWSRFLDGLARLISQARTRAPRLHAILDRLEAERARLAETIDREGAAPPDLERLGSLLPVGDATLPPYDRAPWVMVENDMAVVGRARFTTRDHALVERIDQELTVQRLTGGRGRVALFIPEAGSADVIDSLGALAKRGGAETVELVLTAPLTLRTPTDDVWGQGRPPSLRFVVLPLQLRPSSGRDLPHSVGALGVTITLLVAPEGVTAFASDGALDLGPTSRIGPHLDELRRAFPDEAQVALAIDPTAGYRDVVAAARAARAVFHQVALVDVPRRPFKESFAPRVQRRAAARIEGRSTDGPLAARAAVLRGCYLDALDRDPAVAGSITILPGPPGALPTLDSGGPSDGALRDCLVHRAAAIAAKVPLTVELSPR